MTINEFKTLREEYWAICDELNKTGSCEAWEKKAEAEKKLKAFWKEMGLD